MANKKLTPDVVKCVGFLGGGNMARSLIGGLIANGFDAASIYVSDPLEQARDFLAKKFSVNVTENNAEVVAASSAVILAVKPQIAEDVLTTQVDVFQQNRPLLISIAAGIRLQELDTWSGSQLAIVRMMPNTPALIQQGITAMHANELVTPALKDAAQSILSAVGETVWVERESQLDAVTAVSGSGPAYFFYLIEAMEQAAQELGLDNNTANRLAVQTAVGASLLASQSTESPEALRKQVTSPGGTTEAAVRELQIANVKSHIVRAILAAEHRAVQLSDEFS